MSFIATTGNFLRSTPEESAQKITGVERLLQVLAVVVIGQKLQPGISSDRQSMMPFLSPLQSFSTLDSIQFGSPIATPSK